MSWQKKPIFELCQWHFVFFFEIVVQICAPSFVGLACLFCFYFFHCLKSKFRKSNWRRQKLSLSSKAITLPSRCVLHPNHSSIVWHLFLVASGKVLGLFMGRKYVMYTHLKKGKRKFFFHFKMTRGLCKDGSLDNLSYYYSSLFNLLEKLSGKWSN